MEEKIYDHGLKGRVNNPAGRTPKEHPTRYLRKRVQGRFYKQLLDLLNQKHDELIAGASGGQKSTAGKTSSRNTGSSPGDLPAE